MVSWPFLGAVLTLALLAWVGWRVLGRWRRWLGRVGLAVAVLLSSVGVASAVNRYFDYLPKLGDVVNVVDGERNWPSYESVVALPPDQVLRRYPQGLTAHLRVPDRGSGFGPTEALVYLPPQYFGSPGRRFPVAYLLHGAPGVPGDWFRGGRAGRLGARLAAAGRPLIIVAPRMSRGWLDDSECVDSVRELAETHLVDDVLPAVDGALRTEPARGARVLGGMSAGGYCALNVGLRHRALFGTIVAMSGLPRPTYAGGLGALFGTGPGADVKIRANTPADYGAALGAGPPTRVWLDCGTGDAEILGELRRLAVELRAAGLTVEVHARPGAHTFRVWRPALAEALTWATPGLGSGAG
ncbi:MAG TPA: alpha/beta hydrolase-fold protein [Mycobacteriales bacterium]|nr:alpha/beta hydrolase-fold protein [Mycobacteriales bacterium]